MKRVQTTCATKFNKTYINLNKNGKCVESKKNIIFFPLIIDLNSHIHDKQPI